MKRKWLCALLLCLLPALARADAPDDAMRLVVYTAHKEEVYQPIVEEFERRTGVWVQVVSGGTTELLERIAAEAEAPVAEVPVEEPVEQPAPWRVAGEVLNTYIVVEQEDRVLLIDKHAAHERMNFDRMKAQNYQAMSQSLLSPVVCRLAPQEHAVLLAQVPLLERFGFGVEDFGGASVIVRQAPFDVDAGDIEATLSEIARKLLSTGSADPQAARDELLHTMACKAAIKGGWKTSPQELERVARAVMTGQVKYCPHGRPVAIELTRKELEKQFKRA